MPLHSFNKNILLIGEPMGLFIAKQEGSLEEASEYRFAVAGAEFNVAVGLSRMGHNVGYVTRLGADPFGKKILKALSDNNISTSMVSFDDMRSTGFMLKSKVSSGDPEIYYYRRNSAASSISSSIIDEIDLDKFDYLHLTGIFPALSQTNLNTTIYLIKKAKDKGIIIFFDPNLRPQLWGDKETMIAVINKIAGMSDYFMPGINECEALTGSREPDRAAEFYSKIGAGNIVIKLGEDGAYINGGSCCETVKGYNVEHVVDTVGAGDGFAAGFISALAEGLDCINAVRRGNAVGAMQVMSEGDNEGLPTREELNRFISERGEHI